MKKAIGDSNQIHIRDVGHTMPLLVENLYKNDPKFKAYSRQVGKVKIREVMRPASYLLPPRQRSISRFLNLSSTIAWSVRMLKIWPSLNAEEQKVFAFLTRHRSIIEELQAIFDYVDRTQQEIKSKGLSKKSIDFCLDILEKHLTISNKSLEKPKKIEVMELDEMWYFLGKKNEKYGYGLHWTEQGSVLLTLRSGDAE